MPKINSPSDIRRLKRQALEEAGQGVHIRDFDKTDAELQEALLAMSVAAVKAMNSGKIGKPQGAAAFRMCFGKRLYVTEKEARKAIAQHLKKYGTVMRVYKCPFCKGRHLTSSVTTED